MMSQPSDSEERLLEPRVTKALQSLMGEFRELVLAEAAKVSPDGRIDEGHLVQAYTRLGFPDREAVQFADAQSVISRALRENRILEWVSYAMAITLFLFGLFLLTAGVFAGDVSQRVGCLSAGSIVQVLILIPFRFAINARRHNIALRMLGMIINRVDDPKKLAPLLKDTFLCVVLGRPQLESNT
jgi:hypothetical protein